jgi:hypothetical protein
VIGDLAEIVRARGLHDLPTSARQPASSCGTAATPSTSCCLSSSLPSGMSQLAEDRDASERRPP